MSKLGEEVTSEQAKMLYKEFARSGMFKGNFLKAVSWRADLKHKQLVIV